jgi:L-fucose mutarotase
VVTHADQGHGDRLVLADSNFPSASVCGGEGPRLVRADGHAIPTLLEAILQLLPLDQYVSAPVGRLAQSPDTCRCRWW